MLDHELAAALLIPLRDGPPLSFLNGFTGLDDETHKVPALTVSVHSEPLAGSGTVFRATVLLILESDARDDSPELHAQRVGALRAILADKVALVAAINAGGAVFLHGYAIGATDPGVEATRFRTPITLKGGYSVPE